ncbi:MAG: hypothetical protein K9I68_11215 [Bacteroidales bacterium]|nr:hypothetical protein [Bacteroidales bacterium]MCF8338715.1 hypothetical protein [Bacteroidales bacterium]
MQQSFNTPIWLKIDFRERNSGIPELIENSLYPFEYKIIHLPVGDYLLENKILIERKTLTDFISSVKTGRIFDQAYRLVKTGKPCLLILEGRKEDITRNKIKREAIQGCLIHLHVFTGLPMMRSKDTKETVQLFYYIANQYKRSQIPHINTYGIPSRSFKLHPSRKEKIMILQSLPGIGPQKAINLLKFFGSVEKVIRAEVSELSKVRGIGNKLAKHIYTLTHSAF